MKKFIEKYNSSIIKCKRLKEDGFTLEEKVFVDFFNRNQEEVSNVMKSEIDEITNNMGDFIDSDKAMVANWYLNKVLNIEGVQNEFWFEYDINNAHFI